MKQGIYGHKSVYFSKLTCVVRNHIISCYHFLRKSYMRYAYRIYGICIPTHSDYIQILTLYYRNQHVTPALCLCWAGGRVWVDQHRVTESNR